MSGTQSLRACLVAVACVAAGMLSGTGTARAECKTHVHTATSSAYFKSVAGAEARAAWRYNVTLHDGVTYALWTLAKNKSTVCRKKTNWVCTARATPCL